MREKYREKQRDRRRNRENFPLPSRSWACLSVAIVRIVPGRRKIQAVNAREH